MNHKIRIQYILLLNLLMLLAVLVSFVIAAQWFSTRHKGHLIEQNVKASNKRINTILQLQSKYKSQIVNDYTYWDEMVDFIKNHDDAWGKDNVVSMMKNYDFDFSLTYNEDGELTSVYNLGDELDVMNLVPPAACTHLLFKTGNFHWFTTYNGNTYEIYGATVHPTSDPEHKTAPQGLFMAGNIVSKAYLDNLSQMADANVALISAGEDVGMSSSDEIELAQLPLQDVDQSTVKYLRLTKKPEFLHLFDLWSKTYLAILIGCVAIVLLIYFFALVKWVSKPLQLINHILAKDLPIGRLADLSNYGQEFATIGDLIMKHAEQQNQLAMLKEKAEESDRLKSLFLANMSHEIRTPINGIIGFSELICQDGVDEESAAEFKTVIKSCSHDLMHIMDDIIEIAKIDAGVIKLTPHHFSLRTMLVELDALFAQQITAKNKPVRLIVQKPQRDLVLFGDGYRLKQMIAILLDNSVKFTHQGHVELTYKLLINQIEFKIKDTGVGIRKEKREVIFERFRQDDEQLARAHGGNGLGLAIFKKLADMMNGEVTVESETGKGSAFKLRVPISISDAVVDDHEK